MSEEVNKIRAVIDCNVLFEGLTKTGGAAGVIVDAWLNGLFTPCVSDAVGYEYLDVLQRKLSAKRWATISIALATLLSLAEEVIIYYSWRPTSPDAGDDLVIDCAMNANAIIVTNNRKDFRTAEKGLGVVVLSPVEFVNLLAKEISEENEEEI
jgi:predicted nucleic acid-binding protein